jgi:hypothetical protein
MEVTDLRSNGTFVNAAATPLGQGRSAPLADEHARNA